jgi:hypothetical protein
MENLSWWWFHIFHKKIEVKNHIAIAFAITLCPLSVTNGLVEINALKLHENVKLGGKQFIHTLLLKGQSHEKVGEIRV